MRMDEGDPLSELRSLVGSCLQKHMYEAAAFFAEKLVTMSSNSAEDVFILSESLFRGGEYRRAAHAISSRGLLKGKRADIRFKYLAGKCMASAGEWEKCLEYIGDGTENSDEYLAQQQSMRDQSPSTLAMYSALCSLRARALEELGRQPAAATWYKAALTADPKNVEAMQALLGRHMMSQAHEDSLLQSLGARMKGHPWLVPLYRSLCKQHGRLGTVAEDLACLGVAPVQAVPPLGDEGASWQQASSVGRVGPDWTPGREATASAKPETPVTGTGVVTRAMSHQKREQQLQQQAQDDTMCDAGCDDEMEGQSSGGAPQRACADYVTSRLSTSVDVAVAHARWHMEQGALQEAVAVTEQALGRDPWHTELLEMHVGLLHQTGSKDRLLTLSHRLAKELPGRCITWLCIATFYLTTGKHVLARQYFSRATSAPGGQRMATAWLGFGHAFALCDESDQAVAAYRTALRLFPGLHLPLVCIGMEYQRTNNLPLAEKLLEKAVELCPGSALVYHELGAVLLKGGEIGRAEELFEKAISLLPRALPSAWAATLVCLGHCRRKRRDFAGALTCYRRALVLEPSRAATLAAEAYTYHLMGELGAAIDRYHRVLAMQPDHSFAAEMLTAAIEEHSRQGLEFA